MTESLKTLKDFKAPRGMKIKNLVSEFKKWRRETNSFKSASVIFKWLLTEKTVLKEDLRAEAIKRAKHFKELSETYREDGDSYSASECHGRMLEAMDFANLKEKDLK